MRKRLLTYLTLFLASIASPVAHAQVYSNAVMSLNPVAYWPLNETNTPPAPYYATNSGTLGAIGNGYYETWYNPNGAFDGFQEEMDWTGPVAGATADGDLAASFNGDTQRYIIIPRTSPSMTIKPPFSVECWANPADAGFENLVGEGGNYAHYADSTGQNWYGFSMGEYGGKFIFDLFNANGGTASLELDLPPYTQGQWYHLVATFDGTNANFYVNGALFTNGTPSMHNGSNFVADPVTPVLLGSLNAANYINEYKGTLDEVAIYTNVLNASDVLNHYQAGSNPAATAYSSAVLTNKPLVYLRLDEPLFNLPTANPVDFSVYPAATNYGSLGSSANGFYLPGTLPGVAGPPYAGFGASPRAVALNGVDSAVDVGNGALPTTLDPVGTPAFSVVVWFKGNPSDAFDRFQNILGHTDASWRCGFDTSGRGRFNPGAGPELATSQNINDGIWHQLIGTTDGTNASLYVDGTLNITAGGVGSDEGTAPADIMLGGDPQYMTPYGRVLAGDIAQVAFFTNALTGAQVQMLYTAAGVPPYIITQPVSENGDSGSPSTNIMVVAGGSAPLTYQWYLAGGTLLSGQTNSFLKFNPVEPANNGSYYVVVSSSYGSVTSSIATLTVFSAPSITTQPPATVSLFASTNAFVNDFKVSVLANGAAPLTYQWYVSGTTPVANATNATLSITNVAVGTYTYDVIVSNSVGIATSSNVVLTVVPVTATYPSVVLQDTPIAYYRLDETNGTVSHDFIGSDNGQYFDVVLGQPGYSVADPDKSVLFGPGPDSYAGNINGVDFSTQAATNGGNGEFSVECWVNGYGQDNGNGIVAMGYGSGGEQFDLDTGGGANTFRFGVRNTSGGGTFVTGNDIAPDGNWHHLVGVCDEASGMVILYIDGQIDSSGTITPGSGIRSKTTPMSIGSREGGSGTDYNYNFTGRIDEVALYGYALNPGQVANHYNAQYPTEAPVIVTQPVAATNYDNLAATFTVAAGGNPPLSYQWLFNGAQILGATSSSYTVSPLTASAAGNYSVVVTDATGSTTSSVVPLTILSGTQPVSGLSSNLVLDLEFNGNFLDSSGRGNNATNKGASFVTGIESQQALFYSSLPIGTPSVFDYVTLGQPADLQFGATQDFSVSYWIQYLPSELPDCDLPVFGDTSGGTYSQGFCFAQTGVNCGGDGGNNGTWAWTLNDGANTVFSSGTANDITDGKWHLLVYTFDRLGFGTTYLDGSQVASVAISGLGNININQPVNIGQDASGAYSDGAANLEALRVWRRVLSPVEAGALYVNPIHISASGGSSTINWSMGTLQSASSLAGPWTNVSSTPPYTVTSSSGTKFYRVLP